MNILETLVQLRDDIKLWVTNNLNALNSKIEEKTFPVDSELSSTSENPVQNKIISAELDSLSALVGSTPVADQISTAIASQEHFSGDYNDLTNAPDIVEDGAGDMTIMDENGNIIFKVDENGAHTTKLLLNGKEVATKEYVEGVTPEVDLTGYATEKYVDDAVDTAKSELGESIVSEGGTWTIEDEDGNIALQVDDNGLTVAHIQTKGIEAEDGTFETITTTNIDTVDAYISNLYFNANNKEPITNIRAIPVEAIEALFAEEVAQ